MVIEALGVSLRLQKLEHLKNDGDWMPPATDFGRDDIGLIRLNPDLWGSFAKKKKQKKKRVN